MKKLVKKIGKKIGLSIRTLEYVDILHEQRDSLLEVVTGYIPKKKKGIACVIFSKDRALQLHALLESAKNNLQGLDEIYVIYTHSNESHLNSYFELKQEWLSQKIPVIFIEEAEGFKRTFQSVLGCIPFARVLFLVDDNIIVQSVDLSKFKFESDSKRIVSLRLGDGINYSYNAKKRIKPTFFSDSDNFEGYWEFRWACGEGEWGDPCSLDGHIYDTNLVSAIFSSFSFAGPNSLEAGFKAYRDLFFPHSALCPRKPVVRNFVLNRVQNEYNNRHGQLSANELLKIWNRGQKIEISVLGMRQYNSTHIETGITFIDR